MQGYKQSPMSSDILAPPQFTGPPGQLMPYSSNTLPIGQNYAVYGENVQILQFLLKPGESVESEKGAMVYKAQDIEMKVSFNGMFGRILGGEKLSKNIYTNKGSIPACVSFAPDFPARIIPVDLNRSGPMLVTQGMYLSHFGNVNLSATFARNAMAGCFGGAGFLLLQFNGNGTVFLTGGGTIMEKYLMPGEELLVDTNSLVAFSQSASYQIRNISGLMTCCCGGEGFFNTVITGPGLVVIQTMAKKRLQAAVVLPGSGSGGASATATVGLLAL